MRAGLISAVAAAHGRPVVNVSDLKLLAINAARPIQYLSNHRQAGQCCAATVLVRVVRSPAAEDAGRIHLE